MVKMNATRLFVLLCALSWAGSVTADVFDVEEVLAGPAGLPAVISMGPVQDGHYGHGRHLTVPGYEGPHGNKQFIVVSAISTILGTPNLAPTVDALKTTVNRAAADTNASPLVPDAWISGSVQSFGPAPLTCSPAIPSNFALLFYTVTVDLFDDRVAAFLADLTAAVEGGEFTSDAQAAGISIVPVPVILGDTSKSEVSQVGAADQPVIDWQCFTLTRVPEVTQVPEPTRTPRPGRPTPTPTLRRRLLQAEKLITESEESKP